MAKAKGGYVDGFVLVVPKKNLAVYRKMAQAAGVVWRTYGALDYKECVGDDMRPNTGGMPMLSFPKMAKAKKNEAVWFSYIVYKSRRDRDQVNAKVMNYFDKKYGKNMPMPFYMKRFAYGGFKVIVSA